MMLRMVKGPVVGTAGLHSDELSTPTLGGNAQITPSLLLFLAHFNLLFTFSFVLYPKKR